MNQILTNNDRFCNINPKGDIQLKIITDEKEITPKLIEDIFLKYDNL